jgi:O-antigen/teichoic acid export membrane protein
MTNASIAARQQRLLRLPRVPATSWILIGSVGAGVLNYVFALIMTALLSPSQYSAFAGGQAILLVTGTVASTSVPWLLAREISRSASGTVPSGVVWFATVLNLVLGVGAAALTMALSIGFADLALMAWLGAATLGFFMASTGMGWALGHARFGLLAVLIVAEVAVKVVIGVALVAAGAGPAGVFFAALVGALAITVAMLRPMRRDLHPTRAVLGSRRLWRSAAGMGAVQAVVTLVSVLDVLFIPLCFGTKGEAAGYLVAATLTRAPLFVALAMATSAFPRLTQRPGDRVVLSGTAQNVLAVLVPSLVVIATLPGPVLDAVLPSGYADALRFLPLTATLSTVYGLVVLQTTVFRAAGRSRECLRILAGACAVALLCMAIGSTVSIYATAVGALLGAVTALVALTAQIERRWHGALRPNLGGLLFWLGAATVLIFARSVPWLWLCLAGAIAVQIARAALASPDGGAHLGRPAR